MLMKLSTAAKNAWLTLSRGPSTLSNVSFAGINLASVKAGRTLRNTALVTARLTALISLASRFFSNAVVVKKSTPLKKYLMMATVGSALTVIVSMSEIVTKTISNDIKKKGITSPNQKSVSIVSKNFL